MAQQLKWREGEEEAIHPALLRKYIGWAKKQCHPKYFLVVCKFTFIRLSVEACDAIKNFYLSLRKKHQSTDSTPITTRQLESLIRLSQARAKLEMREEVTQQDALDVIEIMKESLFERLEDEYGNIDYRRNSGMSKGKEAIRFMQILQNKLQDNMQAYFTKLELRQLAQEHKINFGSSFEDFLNSLNVEGFLLKTKSQGGYQLGTIH